MKRHIQTVIFFVAWLFLIYVTHHIIFGVINFLFILPDWSYDLLFYLIAFLYAYIVIRYNVRIEIHLNNKRIFYYRNGGNQ
jgi:hypothetical protein